MRTNVVLDDALVREAFAVADVHTKKDLIDLALRELVRARRNHILVADALREHGPLGAAAVAQDVN